MFDHLCIRWQGAQQLPRRPERRDAPVVGDQQTILEELEAAGVIVRAGSERKWRIAPRCAHGFTAMSVRSATFDPGEHFGSLLLGDAVTFPAGMARVAIC